MTKGIHKTTSHMADFVPYAFDGNKDKNVLKDRMRDGKSVEWAAKAVELGAEQVLGFISIEGTIVHLHAACVQSLTLS